MITLDCLTDKSLYPAQGSGIFGGLLGMILWLFPLQIWTGVLGFFLTIATTAATTFTVLLITGWYKKNEPKILKFFVLKITVNKPKNGKQKKGNKAA